MDYKSKLGYSKGSPYANNPFLDIFTPEGVIDMSNTPQDVLGIDEYDNAIMMKANDPSPYQFQGQMVREIPLTEMARGGLTAKQYMTERGLRDGKGKGDFNNITPNKARKILHDKKVNGKALTPAQFKLFGYLSKGHTLKLGEGGNTSYQMGGINELFSYLFEEDEVPKKEDNQVTAPELDDIEEREKRLTEREQELADMENYQQAMALVLQGENPYSDQQVTAYKPTNKPTGIQAGINPYVTATEKDIFNQFPVTNLGIWGDKSHQARKSDHNTGDAQDFGIKDAAIGDQLTKKLITEAKQRNIKYIVFNGKIWNPSISNEWRPYKGSNPHSDHVHVSYNR